MRSYQDLAARLRWWLLALAVVCLATALWITYGPDAPPEARVWAQLFWIVSPWWPEHEPKWPLDLTIIGVLLLLQWIFLCPRRHWRLRMSERGRPMRTAVIVGAGMAMLLSYALIATLSEIFSGVRVPPGAQSDERLALMQAPIDLMPARDFRHGRREVENRAAVAVGCARCLKTSPSRPSPNET